MKYLIFFFLCACILGKKRKVVVHLNQGSYQGEKYHNHYRFLGIRYAQPVVRFTPPNPMQNNNNNKNVTIEDAIEWKSACPHFPNKPLSGISRDLLKPRSNAYSEDCLFLNVFTPELPLNTASVSSLPSSIIAPHNLPVLMFIHGGAFYSGTSSANIYDPSEWIRQFPHFVVVTFEYRLGPLGYLAAPGVQGNYGLMDQILAVKWVHANVNRFGGSPNNIHIMGHSAGSISASWIAALEAKILPFPISAYILMSGVGSMWPKRKATGAFEKIQYDTLLEESGCSDFECLKKVPLDVLQSANEKMQMAYTWGPTIDGTLIDLPFYQTDHYNPNAKIIITAVRDEGSIFVPRDYAEIADVFFKDKLATILPFYGRKLSFQIINAIITDALFICPMHHFYKDRKRFNADPENVHYFLLGHPMIFTSLASTFNGGRDHGVFHGSDMLMLFGNHPLLSTTYAQITTELRRGIVEFVTKGIIPREIRIWNQEKSSKSALYMEAFEHWSLENHHCSYLWNSNDPLMPKNYKSKLPLPFDSVASF